MPTVGQSPIWTGTEWDAGGPFADETAIPQAATTVLAQANFGSVPSPGNPASGWAPGTHDHGPPAGTTGTGTGGLLVPVAVQTAAYNANPSDFVPIDTSSSDIIVTLPNAPLDGSRVGVKVVAGPGGQGAGIGVINTSGADTFDVPGGSTTASLSLVGQGFTLQYDLALNVWYVTSNDLPLSQLDLRYSGSQVQPGGVPVGGQGAYQNIISSVSTALLAGTWTLVPGAPSIVLPNDGNTYRVELTFPGVQNSVVGDVQVGLGTDAATLIAAIYEDLTVANQPIHIGAVIAQSVVGQGQTINVYAWSAAASTFTLLAYAP